MCVCAGWQFESQDVLVPWDQSQSQSSTEQSSAAAAEPEVVTAAAEPEVVSTASDDDLLAYNAFTQNSDSDSTRSSR